MQMAIINKGMVLTKLLPVLMREMQLILPKHKQMHGWTRCHTYILQCRLMMPLTAITAILTTTIALPMDWWSIGQDGDGKADGIIRVFPGFLQGVVATIQIHLEVVVVEDTVEVIHRRFYRDIQKPRERATTRIRSPLSSSPPMLPSAFVETVGVRRSRSYRTTRAQACRISWLYRAQAHTLCGLTIIMMVRMA